MSTTEETNVLRAQIAELQRALADKEQVLTEQGAKLKGFQDEREGWLIWVPQADFDGNMYGVQFRHGHAFIPKDMNIPAFELTPMNENQMNRYLDMQLPAPLFTQAQREAEAAGIREREKVPTASRLVETLKADFHYQAEFFDATRLDELAERRKSLVEAAQLLMQGAQVTTAQLALVEPGFMGTRGR
jgi:hypothetical protein